MPERSGAPRGGTLAVLAKAPIPGFAKTRLIPRLGEAGAAALHARLARRTVELAAASDWPSVALWGAPSSADPFFDAWRGSRRVRLLGQPEGDLGERMLAAFEPHLAERGPVLLVGTDCPELSPDHLRQVQVGLVAGADAVLLPALDGGYAAIGLARAHRHLFTKVPWGSAKVLDETRGRIRVLGWSLRELSPVRDVDRPEDLDWLLASGLLDEVARGG